MKPVLIPLVIVATATAIYYSQSHGQGKAETVMSEPAITHEGVTYISLRAAAGLIGGSTSFGEAGSPLGLQPLKIANEKMEWRFPNGGDRVLNFTTGETTALDYPLLVLDGEHYIAAEEGAKAIGYDWSSRASEVSYQGNKLELKPATLETPSKQHQISDYQAMQECRKLIADLAVTGGMEGSANRVIPQGAVLAVRRAFAMDGQSYRLVNLCEGSYESFVVPADKLRAASVTSDLRGTPLGKIRERLEAAAPAGKAITHGIPTNLSKSACLTIDLCWSLRAVERDLFSLISEQAKTKKISATLFTSGRWIDQHPLDMQRLIKLGREPNVEIIWGLHSWAHPKQGGFMNEFPVDAFIADNLKMEQQYLNWGIVPTIFYRFPGLIHDETRLKATLGLDLLPIDCTSWLAMIVNKEDGPFAQPVTDGSIILVHGNGNEPAGIPPLRVWINEHPDWSLESLARFLESD